MGSWITHVYSSAKWVQESAWGSNENSSAFECAGPVGPDFPSSSGKSFQEQTRNKHLGSKHPTVLGE